MKFILTILILAITAFAQPDSTVDSNWNRTHFKDGTYCQCDFINRLYWEPNVLFEETAYVDSIRVMVRQYDETGDLVLISQYDVTGVLVCEQPYMHGEKNGQGHSYIHILGVIEMTDQWLNGHRHGLMIWYYESGQVASESMFNKGQLNGKSTWYNIDGSVAGTANYKNGQLVGYKMCTDGRKGNDSLDCTNN